MADASLTFLLGNLKELLVNHVDLIKNAGNELRDLENDLAVMRAALEEASTRHNKNKVFEQWEKKIGDVIHEVEDVIDSWVANKRRLGGTNLAQQVKILRAGKVTPLVAEIKDLSLNPSVAESNPDTVAAETMDKRKKNPRVNNVVGFEDETETLITYLSEPSEALEVISIVGMPGLGKTTVAWKIFKDPKIQFEFPTRIWIHVSQTLNKKDLCLTILKKITQQDFSNKTDNELVRLVKENLDRGKFVIFMDDVWGVQDWEDIKDVLPLKNKLGKVLITSRHEDVACHANPLRQPHKLRFLTEAESWKLLQLEVYCKTDLSPPDTELGQIGQVIASQCGGLPLAIIVIGGILLDKISTARGNSILIRKEWRNVSDSVYAHLITDDKQKRMEYFISLSYDILPYDLRTCFLYLGMFPENTGIPSWKLIQLWIAEGFIKQKRGKSLEEIALDNLKDLICRNLVMVYNTKPDGEVKTCRVHDTIREFCRNEGGLKKNLFQEVEWSKNGVFEPPVNELEKYRRISIHSYVHRFLSKKPKILKARSFLCFSKELIVLENKDIALVYDAFYLLRVLDAETIKFPKFPGKITQLVHLRYLTLSFEELKTLPSVITQLWNLETLIVKTTSRTLDVEANIWKLIHLRYLKTKASIVLKKDNGKKDENCENLQTLSRLSPKSCTDVVFNKANNLNTLGIRGDLSLLLDSKCFGILERLNKLKLVHDIFPEVSSENPLRGLLPPEKFPQNIRTLMMSGSYLSWEPHMSLLGKLVFLEVIKLKDNAFVGDSWDACGGGFLRLEHLHIERTNLKYWTAKEDAFPRLKCLVLKNCEKLQGVPAELEGTLDMLSMERVTPFAVFQANKMKAKKQGRFKLIVAPGDQVIDN